MIHGWLQVIVIWLVLSVPLATVVGLAIAWGDGAPHPDIAPPGDRLPR